MSMSDEWCAVTTFALNDDEHLQRIVRGARVRVNDAVDAHSLP